LSKRFLRAFPGKWNGESGEFTSFVRGAESVQEARDKRTEILNGKAD